MGIRGQRRLIKGLGFGLLALCLRPGSNPFSRRAIQAEVEVDPLPECLDGNTCSA